MSNHQPCNGGDPAVGMSDSTDSSPENNAFEEERRRFVSRLRHDLIGPINTLSGFLELLVEERVGPLNQTQRKYLANMQLAVGRALDLIEATRRQEVQPEPTAIGRAASHE